MHLQVYHATDCTDRGDDGLVQSYAGHHLLRVEKQLHHVRVWPGTSLWPVHNFYGPRRYLTARLLLIARNG
jgi:hypothetical protein